MPLALFSQAIPLPHSEARGTHSPDVERKTVIKPLPDKRVEPLLALVALLVRLSIVLALAADHDPGALDND